MKITIEQIDHHAYEIEIPDEFWRRLGMVAAMQGMLAGPDGPDNTDPAKAGFEDSLEGYQQIMAQSSREYAAALLREMGGDDDG